MSRTPPRNQHDHRPRRDHGHAGRGHKPAPPEPARVLRSPRCPGCGSDVAAKAFNAVEPGFEVLTCRLCGMGRTIPPVLPEQLGRWYPDTYYGKENVRFNALFERLTRLFRMRRARAIAARAKPGPVLDVGCGRGFILSCLRDMGFQPHGIELSDTAAWHARNTLKLDVETCDFLSSPHRVGIYDAVILWHSLEHMPRPAEAVTRARELLKHGGLLAVAVPNVESLQARLFGRRWFHLDVPRHYYHFGAKSLAAMLERSGFHVVREDHFCLEQNPYGWIQSFYNALGFDDNFLYSLLKNRSARTMRIRHHPIQAALTALLLPLVTALSLVMTAVEAALRRGGTIEVYAVKRGA
ncbi:MAG: class I SAM-dependent methyltransferase [Elusimicrobia bacterium]|nr:class I SAM-dependent methyltransferase [Elusimicrobiota bacterium]